MARRLTSNHNPFIINSNCNVVYETGPGRTFSGGLLSLIHISSVVEIMIRIIHSMESQEFFSDEFQPQKMEMLSRLSALTEIGRFYFPNVIKEDYFGHDKPSAYQGYRDICLEFLVYFYNTALKSVDDSNVSVLWKQERNFTALMFDVIEPRKRNRDYSKHLGLTIPKGQAIEDFIYENPKNINVFRS